ncbi:MAG: type III-A CRISPR-associated protein Csm2 [Coleofasciculaceae cyanobacterium SM2_1_6]|nr:type III-A CRISPR-associated protein Csm2 [Coleofasciculaceae cyanobacterium SM2_1_6]
MNRIKDKLVALETDEIIQAIPDDEIRVGAKFEKIKSDIVFLEPKLYYAAREREGEPFKNVISEAILKVKNVADFKRLVELIEATVAYHTYHKRGRN